MAITASEGGAGRITAALCSCKFPLLGTGYFVSQWVPDLKTGSGNSKSSLFFIGAIASRLLPAFLPFSVIDVKQHPS